MERILQVPFADLQTGTGSDLKEFFTHYCRFFQEMTYDTISFEVCITEILPGHGAIMGGRPGPIQNRQDFEQYPWNELSQRFWEKKHIIPQYRRVVELIQKADRPFLWHSCGNIFSIMDEVIAIGINAKHSNEDAIAPFDRWIELYHDRIGLLGGIDVDLLCCEPPETIVKQVVDKGQRFRHQAKGYALGSGNSIPDYVPVEGYLAMIEAAHQIRRNECNKV